MAKPCMYNLRELMYGKTMMCNAMKLADQNGEKLNYIGQACQTLSRKGKYKLGRSLYALTQYYLILTTKMSRTLFQ